METETKDKIDINKLWEALKKECCVNPETALRCVMVTKDQVRAAVKAFEGNNV